MSTPDRTTEQGERSDLFMTRNGLKILRQLTPVEMGIVIPEVTQTSEGFNIHGVNENSLILSLSSLNGVQINTLEANMRPGNMSLSGFLSSEESFTTILAEDNDTVLGLGLTHQQIADFLFYFKEVATYVSSQVKTIPVAFEYNGRVFVHRTNAWRGMQYSPFLDGTATNTDHTITCLTDGSQITYSGLLPPMIYRYGFYEGRGTGYRLEPKRVAEVAGFVPGSEDDPIAELVQNASAAVEITTDDQIIRLRNLLNAGVDVMASTNYRFVPQNVRSLLNICNLFGVLDYEKAATLSEQAKTRRQALAGRIDTQNITPEDLFAGGDIINTLIIKVPIYFPQLQEVVVGNIRTLDSTAISIYLEYLRNAIYTKTADGREHPGKDYYQALVGKSKLTPTNSRKLYKV